jgi:tetratricopeptide (TPR) repeat protein
MSDRDLIGRVDNLCDAGKLEEAIQLISESLEVEPKNPKLWARRGWCYFCAGAFPDAVSDFNEALAQKPGGATTLYFRARAWEELGDLEKALEDYSASIAAKPKADAYLYRGLIRKYLGQIAEARMDFEAAQALNPSDETVARCLADFR